jgi:hypothetical protein
MTGLAPKAVRDRRRLADLGGHRLAVQTRVHRKLADARLGDLQAPGPPSFIDQKLAQRELEMGVLQSEREPEPYDGPHHACAGFEDPLNLVFRF